MSSQLPERADLDHLRGQAKQLLRSVKAGDPAALARLPEPIAAFRLADAQRVIAREYGFPSWGKLKRHVEESGDRGRAMFIALRSGDRETVARLLAIDPQLARAHDPDDFGALPIITASRRNDVGLIDLLLDHGADPNGLSDWWAGGFRAIDFADEATSRHLVKRGATLTAHAAARLGWVPELRAILASDPAVVHERGGDGQFPLHFTKTPEIVDLLLDAGADIDARDVDHEGTAAQFNVLEAPVCRRLVERGAGVDVFMATVLDDAERLETILKSDPDSVRRSTTDAGNPLIPQAPGHHIYLYTLGSSLPHQVGTERGCDRAYQVLFEHSPMGLQLASAAYRVDRATCSRLLAAHSGLVDRLSHQDQTMLPRAAWLRRTEAVRLMLELGFDPNARGDEDSAAIDRAAFHGFDDVIEAILPYRPDLTVRNAYGGTPLEACLYGSLHSWRKDGNFPRSVRLLVENGSPPPRREYGSQAVREVLAELGIEPRQETG